MKATDSKDVCSIVCFFITFPCHMVLKTIYYILNKEVHSMTIDTQNLLNSIMESFDRIEHVRAEDIPGIDLYMDQVTTFMEGKLQKTTRNPGADKILTKTMINNYAKNDLLPPPVKKKYSREHVLLLIFIYYYKNVLSITDIRTLLAPLTETFFQAGGEWNLEKIYEEVFSLEEAEVGRLKEDVLKKFKQSEATFDKAPEEQQEFLHKFAFICMLSFDVYVKKLLIEKVIDSFREPEKEGKTKEKKQGK